MSNLRRSDYGNELIRLLQNNISQLFNDESKISIAFSGGIDSTLLVRLALGFGEVFGVVAGTAGCADIRNARAIAGKLGITLDEVIIDEESAIDSMKDIIEITGCLDPVFISFELPIYHTLIHTEDEILVTGQGADELFAGYSKYERASLREFAQLREIDIKRLLEEVVNMEDEIGACHGKSIMRPFVAPDIVSFAMDLSIEEIYPIEERKSIIRNALIELGLGDIATMRKKAAQYGSGSMNLMKKIARRNGQNLRDMITNFAGESG